MSGAEADKGFSATRLLFMHDLGADNVNGIRLYTLKAWASHKDLNGRHPVSSV